MMELQSRAASMALRRSTCASPRPVAAPVEAWTHDGAYPRDIFFKRQRAYLYRFDLPEKSLDFVAIKMRGPQGGRRRRPLKASS